MTTVCCFGLHSVDFFGSPDSEEEEVQLSHEELRQRIINTVRTGNDHESNGELFA